MLEKAAKDNPNALAMNLKIVKPNGKPFFKGRSHLIDRAKWMGRGWPVETLELMSYPTLLFL